MTSRRAEPSYYISRWRSAAARAEGAASPPASAPPPARRVRLSATSGIASRSPRADVPVAGLPPALAGLRIGLITDVHRSRWVSHDDVAHAVDTADAASARSDRPRRRLRHLGRPAISSRRRPRRSRALSAPHGVFAILGNHDDDHDMPAALAKHGVEVLQGRADAADHPRRSARARRHPLLDPAAADIAAVSAAPTRPVILLAHDPRRLDEAAALNVRWCCRVTRTAVRSCCPASAQSPHRSFRWSPASAGAGQHDDVRQPRRRNGLRAGPDQLPAGSRGADARARQPPAPDSPTLPRRSPSHEPPAVEPPAAVEHQLESPRDRAGAPRRGCAPTASRPCRRPAPAPRACSDDRSAVELGGHEMHGRAASP